MLTDLGPSLTIFIVFVLCLYGICILCQYYLYTIHIVFLQYLFCICSVLFNIEKCDRADCSNADRPGAIPQHNGLTAFGKVHDHHDDHLDDRQVQIALTTAEGWNGRFDPFFFAKLIFYMYQDVAKKIGRTLGVFTPLKRLFLQPLGPKKVFQKLRSTLGYSL